MSPRDAARAMAFGRIGLGIALIVAPRRAAALSLGDAGAGPGSSVFGRALGIRDLIFGGMVLHTVDHPQAGPRWLAACGVADAVDGAAMLAVRDDLPPVRGRLTILAAGGAALANLALSRVVASSEGDVGAQDAAPPPAQTSAPPVSARAPEAPAPADQPAEPATSAPDPAAAVMPDGADEAKRAMGARTIGVDAPGTPGSSAGGVGSGAGPGGDPEQTGGLQQ